jgi:hypothetical protein
MHRLTKADAKYVFYHDETNNIRKLRLSDQGFNVKEPAFFVLGGVVHEGSLRQLDIGPLRRAMHVQTSADEIKLKHVAKGDFLDLLTSGKLTTFLQWISDNGLFIHYHALDPLYWSLVDIIDSILSGLDEQRLLEFHIPLKADLFYRYNYPDLAPQNRKPFLNEFITILEHSVDALPEFNSMLLKGMLQAGCNLPSLDFVEGFTPHLLIESFTVFYMTRIARVQTFDPHS